MSVSEQPEIEETIQSVPGELDVVQRDGDSAFGTDNTIGEDTGTNESAVDAVETKDSPPRCGVVTDKLHSLRQWLADWLVIGIAMTSLLAWRSFKY